MRNKILCADDEEYLRNLYKGVISHVFPNYELEIFGDGTSLAGRLERDVSNVGLVLTDNDMPGITGSEIIRKYARRPEFADKIPFILLYGKDSDGTLGKEAVKNGAFDYVLKPFSILQLFPLLQKALEQYR
jgi:DNA-binding NtrC family response regulator